MSLPTAVYHGSTRIKVRIDSNVPVQEIINRKRCCLNSQNIHRLNLQL